MEIHDNERWNIGSGERRDLMTDKHTTASADGVPGLNGRNGVASKQDFIRLVRELAEQHRQKPQEWENRDLPSYLEALAAWVEDMEGFYANQGQPLPDPPGWGTLGQALLAARV